MTAYEKFRKRIFTGILALLGNRFIADFTFGTSPRKLLLNPIISVPVDYRIVMVGHQIHWSFSMIFYDFMRDTVDRKSLLQKRIAYIFFVLQNP